MARINNPVIVVGGGATVQLYAPTISLSGLTLTITNSANNGAFVEGYDIYSGSTKIGTTTSTTYDLASSSGMTSGSNSITVKATAQGFIDSASSNAETVSIYTVTNTLSNITTSNSASIVLASGSYSATLTPATGWTYGTTTVTMGGNDITSTAYDNGVITIASVTGNIVVTATAYIPVTNTLTGASNSNSATGVAYGSSYTGTITVSSGYTMEGATISITMGGVDITSTAYSNGTITIASVTGAVAITISAVVTVMPYIKFESNDNTQFTLVRKYSGDYSWEGTMEVSQDGIIWNAFNLFGYSDSTIQSSSTGQLYVRGSNNTTLKIKTNSQGIWRFSNLQNTTTKILCSGNIEGLLDYNTVQNGGHPTMGTHAFYYMFYGNTSLLTPPDLCSLNVSDYGYANMFAGCSSLTNAPKINATSLGQHACDKMFANCSNLTQIPALYTLSLPDYCYDNMFYKCNNIYISTTQTSTYSNSYRIPIEGNSITVGVYALNAMFNGTANNTFYDAVSADTTYYTSNTVVYPT